jgi:hypothetical protein
MGTLMGLFEIAEFSTISKDSPNWHDNTLHPQRYVHGDGRTYRLTHI